MKIIYKIYNNWNQNQIKILNQFDIKVELGYDSFDIEEGDTYFKLEKYLKEWKVSEFYGTQYDIKEIESAKLLVYNGTWSNGYPQPEDDFGYIDRTYKRDGYCKSCGTGLLQQDSFRIKKEPIWGNKKIFDLNWVFDEIFVSKESYETIFKNFGIGFKEVKLFKKETVIQNTIQLDIPVSNAEINLQNQPYETCNVCGIKKYTPQIKGFFPAFKKESNGIHCFKSLEYFGSGASAYKKIFISQELRQIIVRHKIKSQFIPCRSHE